MAEGSNGWRGGIVLICLIEVLAGRGGVQTAVAAPIAIQPASGIELETEVAPRLDILGNEVENAVADYRIDLGGTVYERHSPDTAVRTPGSPTT